VQMARHSNDRLVGIAGAAARVFAQTGYRRAQMADVARELGASQGKLYNYVESKDALFLLALRHALGEDVADVDRDLPLSAVDVEVTTKWLEHRLDFVRDYPQLEAIFDGAPYVDGEVATVVGELHDVLAHMRLGVEMIERSVRDLPELAAVFGRVRRELLARYERYLRLRAAEGHLRGCDSHATSHLIVELCWWAAGGRLADPEADAVTADQARAAVCDLVVAALRRGNGRGGP
jgi:AcrR family transcriptional regulator